MAEDLEFKEEHERIADEVNLLAPVDFHILFNAIKIAKEFRNRLFFQFREIYETVHHPLWTEERTLNALQRLEAKGFLRFARSRPWPDPYGIHIDLRPEAFHRIDVPPDLDQITSEELDKIMRQKIDEAKQRIEKDVREKYVLEKAEKKLRLESFEYDIAISFAGENRKIAEDLAEKLHSKGIRVFYDEFYKHELWGKDLAKYLQEVYGPKTKFVLVLISKHYPVKDWTNFEFSVIRTEAKKRQTEFILPIRLDNTKIFGIYDSIAYLDYKKEGIDRIVDHLSRKLGTITYSDKTSKHQEVRYLPGWKVPLTIWWDQKQKVVRLIDQSLIPNKVSVIGCKSWKCIEEAMKTLKIRGASALGAAGAYALALEAQRFEGDEEGFFRKMEEARSIVRVRPTSVNLDRAVRRVYETLLENRDEGMEELKETALKEAKIIVEEDIMANKMLGKHGLEIFGDCIPKNGEKFKILTHSHAGSLATCGYGTVFGVIRTAFMEGVNLHVNADETRPQFHGARITAWELKLEGIPVELNLDSAAGWIMKKEGIDMVTVGADRIAANGDTVSSIGTYSLSILAKEHEIPFYIASPLSSIAFYRETGNDFALEMRSFREVTHFQGIEVSPHLDSDQIRNYAFDVTPHENISGIITEAGIIREPYEENMQRIFNR